jgi:hypothetical protein
MQGWNDLEPDEPMGPPPGGPPASGNEPATNPAWTPPAGGPGPDHQPAGVGHMPRHRLTRTAIVGAVAAGLLVVAGVSIAVAQTSSTSTPSTTVPSGASPNAPGYGRHGMKGGPGGPMGGFGRTGAFGMNGVIHGEFVRPNGSNGFQTVDIQSGQVTDVSTSSITIKSADGFTKTYSVTTNTLVDAGRDGIGNVKKGDNAVINAVISGGKSEARNINDLTNLANIHKYWAPNAPNQAPSTSPTTSA